MDFLSIRRKARERAEAQARREAAAAPHPRPAEAPVPPAPPVPEPPIEQALRAEAARPALAPAPEPPPPAAAPPAAAPADPLEAFFWREDEEAPPIPDLGGTAPGAGAGGGPGQALREYVTFLLAGEEYGLAIGRVREIVKPPPIAEVPRAPEHVVGVVTLRGEVVPVFDPRRRLSLPPQAPGARTRIVVCESARGPAGLLVDAVSHVVRLPPGAVEPRPPGIGGAGTEAIVGIGREGERLVILLDLDLLLGTAAPPPAEAR
ncbi:MAG: purine-binding chemotaxis protein CheW [Deltaproteobacteria bacterium]|nr:purine-binding chemotaxis protein CheW [Deltaproteobacteria bacterium]